MPLATVKPTGRAIYLEPAIDVDGEHASLDAGLHAAAAKESVPLIDPD